MSDEMQKEVLSHCLAIKAAHEAVEAYMEHIDNTIYLNEEDWEFFVSVIENPPEPNEKLKALMSKTPCWARSNV